MFFDFLPSSPKQVNENGKKDFCKDIISKRFLSIPSGDTKIAKYQIEFYSKLFYLTIFNNFKLGN
jgi:hypothetical protein